MNIERKKEIGVIVTSVLYSLFTWLVFAWQIPAMLTGSLAAAITVIVLAIVWAAVMQFCLMTTFAHGGFGGIVIVGSALMAALVGRFLIPIDIAAIPCTRYFSG